MKKKYLKHIICGVLLLSALVLLLRNCILAKPQSQIVSQAKIQYSTVSTEFLGEYLAESLPASKAIVLYDSLSSSQIIAERLNGLRKGLKKDVEILMEIGLPSQAPLGVPPEMLRSVELITAKDFNDAMKKYPQADLVISLVGLPADIHNMDIWKVEDKKKRPRLAVFGGNPKFLAEAVRADYIQALVVFKQMDKYAKMPPPSNLKEAFNRRFVLYTPQNIGELLPDTKEPKR